MENENNIEEESYPSENPVLFFKKTKEGSWKISYIPLTSKTNKTEDREFSFTIDDYKIARDEYNKYVTRLKLRSETRLRLKNKQNAASEAIIQEKPNLENKVEEKDIVIKIFKQYPDINPVVYLRKVLFKGVEELCVFYKKDGIIYYHEHGFENKREKAKEIYDKIRARQIKS